MLREKDRELGDDCWDTSQQRWAQKEEPSGELRRGPCRDSRKCPTRASP